MKNAQTNADYRNRTLAQAVGWPATVAGRYALDWEQQVMDQWVADVFGYHALQLGLPAMDGLRANRMPSRWLLCDEAQTETQSEAQAAVAVDMLPPAGPALMADFQALPFPASSLDLVVMPHTLEASADPHQTLREVERVLRPEGRLVITGFNPASLWGLVRRGRRATWRAGSPDSLPRNQGDWVGYWRLRDWLRLLNFEVDSGRFGCYIPPVASERWRDRTRWLEGLGDRWWPVLGSVYAVTAVKRVRGMRVVGLARTGARIKAPAPAVVAQRHRRALPPDPTGGASS